MLKLLMRFLPKDKRLLLQLALRITANLDTPEERQKAVWYGVGMLRDGRVTVGEWAKFGSILGVLRGRHTKG
jgi:hypothetical protein